jgi:hypothetical protein
MSADTLILDTLTDTVAASAEHSTLRLRRVTRDMLAVLIAVGAPPHVLHSLRLGHRGKRPDYRGHPGVMIAVASVAGAPRVTAAGRHVRKAPGLAIAVADAELASQIESSNSSPAGAG